VKHVGGMKLLGHLRCEQNENRDFSIFHKINTNVTVMKYLTKTFNLNSFNELISLIDNRKLELFNEGIYFSEIWKILKITEDYGDKNEYLSIEYIKNVIKEKLQQDITPLKSPSGSYDDMINGIDIRFEINKKEYTCQVKPLAKITEDENNYIVTSSGNIKQYKTDYLSFSNHKTGETALFRNKEVRINGNILIISKKERVIT
jgi:hypothetical protein